MGRGRPDKMRYLRGTLELWEPKYMDGEIFYVSVCVPILRLHINVFRRTRNGPWGNIRGV